jgi:hypothetical protein
MSLARSQSRPRRGRRRRPTGQRRSRGESIPWVAILDADGRVLVTSDSPAGPIGFPDDDADIGYMMHMLTSTVQRAAPEQLQQLREELQQRGQRN